VITFTVFILFHSTLEFTVVLESLLTIPGKNVALRLSTICNHICSSCWARSYNQDMSLLRCFAVCFIQI